MQEKLDRRDLLKAGALAAVAAGQAMGAKTPAPLKVGLVGAGARGTALLEILLGFEGVEVPAVCDVNENVLARAQQMIQAKGRKVEGYSRGATDYQRLCGRDDLDLVLIATPPELHARIAGEALKAGKHAATEPPAAMTLDDCVQLVETAEKSGRHFGMLASNCYTRQSLMVLTMFRAGLFGDPLFAETGYCRDLRSGGGAAAVSAVRAVEPIAPVAWWMNINRGDRFLAVSSMRTKTAGLGTAIMRTAGGRVITLYIDTGTPRPSEGLMRVQGSKGSYYGSINKIFIDGRSNRNEGPNWLTEPELEDMPVYEKEFAPALWKTQGERAKGSAEYMALYRLVKQLRESQAPDIDVYDAAAWTAVGVLVDQSIAGGSRVMDVPDFTHGRWERRAPVEAGAIV